MARTIEGKEKKQGYSIKLEPYIKKKIVDDYGSLANWLRIYIDICYPKEKK